MEIAPFLEKESDFIEQLEKTGLVPPTAAVACGGLRAGHGGRGTRQKRQERKR